MASLCMHCHLFGVLLKQKLVLWKAYQKNVRINYWPFFFLKEVVSPCCMHRGESMAGLY